MADLRFAAQTAQITTTTSTKTLLQIVAASNQRIKTSEWSCSFQGTSNTATPIQVDIVRQTSAGTMSALTLQLEDNDLQETIQSSAQTNATVEPTDSGAILATENIHPQQGQLWQSPFAGEYKLKGGTRLGLRTVTPGASVSAVARMRGEE